MLPRGGNYCTPLPHLTSTIRCLLECYAHFHPCASCSVGQFKSLCSSHSAALTAQHAALRLCFIRHQGVLPASICASDPDVCQSTRLICQEDIGGCVHVSRSARGGTFTQPTSPRLTCSRAYEHTRTHVRPYIPRALLSWES
jgi:hypothetical protein